jgi:hypothetical protein
MDELQSLVVSSLVASPVGPRYVADRNHWLPQFCYCAVPICFHGYLVTEPLRSSARFLAAIDDQRVGVTLLLTAREPMGVGAAAVGTDRLALDLLWVAPTLQ